MREECQAAELSPGHLESIGCSDRAILQHGGKLSGLTLLTHRDWKTLVEQTRVQGRQPEVKEHFVALRVLLHLRIARLNLLWTLAEADGPIRGS